MYQDNNNGITIILLYNHIIMVIPEGKETEKIAEGIVEEITV